MDKALSLMSSITRFATTTDTGDPIAVPCAWRYSFPLKDKKVAFKHRDSRPMMSSTLRLVHSEREVSLSSLWRTTRMARSVGTEVNNDTTSNDTKVSSSSKICELMNSISQLHYWYLLKRQKKWLFRTETKGKRPLFPILRVYIKW